MIRYQQYQLLIGLLKSKGLYDKFIHNLGKGIRDSSVMASLPLREWPKDVLRKWIMGQYFDERSDVHEELQLLEEVGCLMSDLGFDRFESLVDMCKDNQPSLGQTLITLAESK